MRGSTRSGTVACSAVRRQTIGWRSTRVNWPSSTLATSQPGSSSAATSYSPTRLRPSSSWRRYSCPVILTSRRRTTFRALCPRATYRYSQEGELAKAERWILHEHLGFAVERDNSVDPGKRDVRPCTVISSGSRGTVERQPTREHAPALDFSVRRR